jgi:hypothetical protein
MARVVECAPKIARRLQKRLTALAFVGQDHKSVSVTATIGNFVCEQEPPLIDLIGHLYGIRRQFLRLANGTALGSEHTSRLALFQRRIHFRIRKVDRGQGLSRMI